mgnify:FL=1
MEPVAVPCPVGPAVPTGQTNAYVLGEQSPLVVDPAASVDELDALPEIGHIALTHHHPDHTAAVAAYAESTDATVWCRTGRNKAFEAATGVVPDRTFAHGTRIPTGDGPVRVVDTPGHAPEHVAFGVTNSAGEQLVVGDLAVASGSVAVAAPDGHLRAYLISLRRIWAQAPARLHPAHGPVIADPRDTCRRLIEHRLDREQSILEAVEAGQRTLEAITDAAYQKDIAAVRKTAMATVLAHLQKLAADGAIAWDGQRARPLAL